MYTILHRMYLIKFNTFFGKSCQIIVQYLKVNKETWNIYENQFLLWFI